MVAFAISGEFVAGYYRPSPWRYAHATFYGDETGSETMGTYVSKIVNFHVHIYNIITKLKKMYF